MPSHTKNAKPTATPATPSPTKASRLAKKRGAGGVFRLSERDVVTYGVTPAGVEARAGLERRGASGDEAGSLTPEMLRSGAWKGLTFRRYNVDVPPTRVPAGRRNPYCQFLDRLKDKLCSLGFEEFDGPLVETGRLKMRLDAFLERIDGKRRTA